VFHVFDEISYVESHVCVKASCLDDNLVLWFHISVLETLSLEYKDGQKRLSQDFAGQSTCERQFTCLTLLDMVGLLL
jgi:hypothetical protein